MATGYTHDVKEGKVTSFREFALACARAFGANVTMRDEPSNAPIREYKVDTYYEDRVGEAKKDLQKAQKMTFKEAELLAEAEYDNALKSEQRYSQVKADERRRYEAMIAKVESWTPPTVDHQGLKKFMLEQLQDSLEWDCGSYPSDRTPRRRSKEEVFYAAKEDAERNLTRAVDDLNKERQRVKERNEWNQTLVKSLR